jgi:hypothetical protein
MKTMEGRYTHNQLQKLCSKHKLEHNDKQKKKDIILALSDAGAFKMSNEKLESIHINLSGLTLNWKNNGLDLLGNN